MGDTQVIRPQSIHQRFPIPLQRRSPATEMQFQNTKETRFKMDAKEGDVADVPFEIRFSLGNLISLSGFIFATYSVGSFLTVGEADFVATLGFVYGIPALVGGLALKYAEVAPVPFQTSPAAEAARKSKAGSILDKIISDATRYTYGDAHLEDPLISLKLSGSNGPPELVNMAEEVTETGQYKLTFRFKSQYTPYNKWKSQSSRYAGFFGPGVRAELFKYDGKQKLVDLSLITVNEGDDLTPIEVLADGTRKPLLTLGEKRAADKAAGESS
jgi:hypothetical protein